MYDVVITDHSMMVKIDVKCAYHDRNQQSLGCRVYVVCNQQQSLHEEIAIRRKKGCDVDCYGMMWIMLAVHICMHV